MFQSFQGAAVLSLKGLKAFTLHINVCNDYILLCLGFFLGLAQIGPVIATLSEG